MKTHNGNTAHCIVGPHKSVKQRARYWQTQRPPENRKYITYRNAVRGGRATVIGSTHKNLVMIGLVVLEISSRTDHRQPDELIANLSADKFFSFAIVCELLVH